MICVKVEEDKILVSLHFPASLFAVFANSEEKSRVELKSRD